MEKINCMIVNKLKQRVGKAANLYHTAYENQKINDFDS
jgi:hypothetical protein